MLGQLIVKRLTSRLSAKGVPDARAVALEQLAKHGILKPGTEELTFYGATRNAMTPAARAKDRASRASGNHTPKEYTYDKTTNRAYLKRDV